MRSGARAGKPESGRTESESRAAFAEFRVDKPKIDRIERAARFSGGIPAVAGGEFTGSLRSGRVVDTMAAFSIDPRIAELQNIMARALNQANEAVAEVEKGYFGNRHMVAFSGWLMRGRPHQCGQSAPWLSAL